jgi:hypothetical protein
MKSYTTIALFGAFTILTAGLSACKEDSGLHLGNFKNECAAKHGVLSLVDKTKNDYKCTLEDGTVLLSKTIQYY